MSTAWIWLSELGNSKWLLPATALFIIVSSITGTLSWRTGLRWGLAITTTATIVLTTKVAFMGWGVGSATLDFTGISGHASMAACIYPPLAALICPQKPQLRGPLVGAAALLAAAIAYSRLALHAHSLSEVITGLLLGGLAAAAAIPHGTQPTSASTSHRWKWLPLCVALVLLLQLPLPRTDTHQAVIAVARALSGREQIHTRNWLHTNSELSRK